MIYTNPDFFIFNYFYSFLYIINSFFLLEFPRFARNGHHSWSGRFLASLGMTSSLLWGGEKAGGLAASLFTSKTTHCGVIPTNGRNLFIFQCILGLTNGRNLFIFPCILVLTNGRSINIFLQLL